MRTINARLDCICPKCADEIDVQGIVDEDGSRIRWLEADGSLHRHQPAEAAGRSENG